MTELLSAEDVFRTFKSTVALDGVDVTVAEGRSVGVAGESGSGKTTLLRQFLGLDRPTRGTVSYLGTPIDRLDREQRRQYRSDVQAVFQDPGTSLDPRWPVWRSICEPITANERHPKVELRTRATELLEAVGLSEQYLDRLPHQMSGGERQRTAIARALSTNPRTVLLDEPVTALDISVRGSILNLLREASGERDTTVVVVSHDLLAVAYLTDFVYVMYQGKVVESGPTLEIIESPQHPYTELLVRTAEDPLYIQDMAGMEQLDEDSAACPYRTRCPFASDLCAAAPDLVISSDDHAVACHHPRQNTGVHHQLEGRNEAP